MSKRQEKLRKAVGGIIAILLIISAVIITFALIEFGISAQQKQAELQQQTYAAQAKSASIAKAVEGIWLYDNSTGTLTINITNHYTEPVKITGIIVFLENGQIEVINETYTALNGIFTFPQTIMPGQTLTIQINAPAKPKTITFSTLSMEGYTVVAIAAKPYIPTAANITLAPTITVQNLPTTKIYGAGTVTWCGTANITVPTVVTADIVSAKVNNASITNYDNLEHIDGNTVYASSILGGIIILEQNNTLYYEDFTTNPIGITFITNTNTWRWSMTYGYDDGGIYQRREALSEILGYFNDFTLPSQQTVYIASKVYHVHASRRDWDWAADIILYSNDTNDFYAFSTYVSLKLLSIRINLLPLNLNVGDISQNAWLAYHLLYNPLTGFMNFTVYDIDSSDYVGSVSAIDTSISPVYIGLGTYAENARFDDVLVSLGNTRFVNVTGVPAGYIVELWSDSALIASGVSNDPSSPVVLDVSTNYVIKNARFVVKDPNGIEVPLYHSTFNVVFGGNVYRFIPRYLVDIKTTTYTNINNATELDVCVFFNSNVSVDASILIYNFDRVSFDNISSFAGISSLSQCISISDNVYQYISPTGNSIIDLFITSSVPFEITVDMFNLNVTFPVVRTKDVLIVGVGGTSTIEVYYLSAYSETISFSKALEINAHTLFNGSATLTYANAISKLLMINSTGTYTIDLLPNSSWSLLTSQVNSSGAGVQAEVIGQYLIVIRGGNTGNFIVYNLNPTNNGTVQTPPKLNGLIVHDYSASASNGTHAFFLVFNSSSYEAVIVAYNPSSGWLTQEVTVPGSDSVGLCYGGGYLWLMLKGGSLYRIDFDSATVTNTNIVLPSYPISYGDRLEYYGGKLIFVRDDNTNEVLII